MGRGIAVGGAGGKGGAGFPMVSQQRRRMAYGNAEPIRAKRSTTFPLANRCARKMGYCVGRHLFLGRGGGAKRDFSCTRKKSINNTSVLATQQATAPPRYSKTSIMPSEIQLDIFKRENPDRSKKWPFVFFFSFLICTVSFVDVGRVCFFLLVGVLLGVGVFFFFCWRFTCFPIYIE